MTRPVRRTNQAERDLDEIWLQIAADDVDAADRMIERISTAEDRLGDYPELGQARDDLAEGLRHLPTPPYLILYRADPQQVLVVRVLHGARDLPRLIGP